MLCSLNSLNNELGIVQENVNVLMFKMRQYRVVLIVHKQNINFTLAFELIAFVWGHGGGIWILCNFLSVVFL